MQITPLSQELIPAVQRLTELGAPYIRPRSASDYWLYAHLFSSTCPIAVEQDAVIGAVIAFRSQDDPNDVYLQDVMTHPDYRRRGVATALVTAVCDRATAWDCKRLYLTSEPQNTPALAAWKAFGFVNLPGDTTIAGIPVSLNFKGPGKHRAVYQLVLS